MIRAWLQKMFGWPCDHRWTSLGEVKVYDPDRKSNIPSHLYVIFVCEKCLKRRKINR